MPAATPDRVLNKFRKLHTKLRGSDKIVSFLKFTNTYKDPFTSQTSVVEEETLVDPQPIIKDQVDENLAASFGGAISKDQKIFIFVVDSFISRTPIDTLANRAMTFLLERSGQNIGAIKYGDDLYVITELFARPIMGSIPARFFVLGTAQKK